MELERGWLKCKVSDGVFPTEYAVSCNSSDGNVFSFFASENYIDPINNLVQVHIMECQSESCLIYIPFTPLEGINRVVKVFTKDIVTKEVVHGA